MKCFTPLLLLVLVLYSPVIRSQAPDWHWTRLLDDNSQSSDVTVLATSEGGCYVQQGDQVHRYNDFGDLLWTIGFSEAVRLFRTADQESAGFILQYQDNADAAGTSFTAAPGISFVTGFFAADGSLYDLRNYPALLGLQNTVTVADVHRGSGGDILLIGHFSNSLQVGDTTIIGYGHSGFLVRVSTDGILQWAMSLMNTDAGSFGGSSAQVKQSVTGDIYINLGSPYPGSASDTLFGPAWGGSAFARFTGGGEIIWSFFTEGGSLAGDEVLFDLNSDGGLYYARQTLGMNNEIALLGAVDENGELVWETPYIDHFRPANVSAGPSGVLFSGWRFGPVDLQGCSPIPSSTPRTFMMQFDSNDQCEWIKSSPSPAYGFHGYAVEGPQGIYYTIGGTDYWTSLGFGTDTLQFQPGGSVQYYVARLGVLPMITSELPWRKVDHLKAYPNPASGELFVTVPAILRGDQAVLYDALGRTAVIFTVDASTERIDLTGISAGTYLLKCRDQSVRIVIE